MSNKRLFSEFPPVTTEEWIKKIEKDLKGKPFEKLIKETEEGFKIKPFYREEDIRNLPHMKNLPGKFPFLRGNKTDGNPWLVRQNIKVENIEKANGKAVDIHLKGADSIGFVFDEDSKIDDKNLDNLLKNIRADIVELNFSGLDGVSLIKAYETLIKKYNRDFEKIKGSVDYNPLGFYSIYGYFKNGLKTDFDKIAELFKAGKYLPYFRLLTVDAGIFHNSGGNIVDEIAFALSAAVEYLNFLTENGFDIDEIAPKMTFKFAVGSNYFMEIAKFRVFRFLWSKIVNAYGLESADNAKAYIYATNSTWNKTVYDPYVNMLRTTTETMAAVIGGVDSFSVLPFDSVFTTPDEFSERIARNQQLVLKEESYFDKVTDPAAGSYYIENLTKELIDKSWQLFLEIDDAGGYIKAFEKGLIQKKIKDSATLKNKKIATGKSAIVGVNKYPNITERLDKTDDESVLFPVDLSSEKSEAEPLVIYRGAMPFERLRYKTDRYSDNNPRPVVWMFTYGNLAMRRARSQFATNFFGIAGFEIVDNPGFKNIEEGIKEAEKSKADIVVLCSSDVEYKDTALQIFNALKDDFTVVLAGYPEELIPELEKEGFNNFIHTKSNILEELEKYQKLLGIF